MDPMTYGETIAVHLAELRETAAQERAARQYRRSGVAAWRRLSGRLLVTAGERLQGCALGASVEPRPGVRVLG